MSVFQCKFIHPTEKVYFFMLLSTDYFFNSINKLNEITTQNHLALSFINFFPYFVSYFKLLKCFWIFYKYRFRSINVGMWVPMANTSYLIGRLNLYNFSKYPDYLLYCMYIYIYMKLMCLLQKMRMMKIWGILMCRMVRKPQ